MDDSLELLARNLGSNIAALRAKRQLSQERLAKLAGIPRTTLANIESGAGNPSLANLARLAAGLQISLDELVAAPRAPIKLIKSSELRVIHRAQGGALVYKLLPDPVPGMEIDRMEIEPGQRMGGIPHTAGTKEYLTCIQGELSVQVAGSAYRVQTGDVLAFPGDERHSYHNTGRVKSICLSVVTLAHGL